MFTDDKCTCLFKEIQKKISSDGINMTMDAITIESIDASLIEKMVRNYKKCNPQINVP